MVTVAPIDNADSVEKEIMTEWLVVLKDNVSESCIRKSWSCVSPPIAGEYENELNVFEKSILVLI